MTQPKTDESFEAIAAARVRDAEYYRDQLDKQTAEKARAVLAAEEAQELLTAAHFQMAAMKAEINSLKEQRDQAQKEALNLRKKLEASEKKGESNAILSTC